MVMIATISNNYSNNINAEMMMMMMKTMMIFYKKILSQEVIHQLIHLPWTA